MKQKLHKDLQALLKFYQQQRQNPPEEFTHATGVIDKPSFFTVTDLQRHLNNPLLRPEWVHVKLDGDRVELEKSFFSKTVQRRKLEFLDKQLLNDSIKQGAAVVLEGIDILDPGINEFVARLDDSLPCSMCNSVAFWSQQANEAYEGHLDADDVLVVHLAGRKTWQLFAPQPRRYAEIHDLSAQQLGPVKHELTLRPGDALYVRAGVPHRCTTAADYSLHMAFDLIDSTPSATEISAQAAQQYNFACELPYESSDKVIDRFASILESTEFQDAVQEATNFKRGEIQRFREMLGRTSVVRSLGKFS